MLPSGKVLLGIKEQEKKVPNILIVQQCLVAVIYPINIFAWIAGWIFIGFIHFENMNKKRLMEC